MVVCNGGNKLLIQQTDSLPAVGECEVSRLGRHDPQHILHDFANPVRLKGLLYVFKGVTGKFLRHVLHAIGQKYQNTAVISVPDIPCF